MTAVFVTLSLNNLQASVKSDVKWT